MSNVIHASERFQTASDEIAAPSRALIIQVMERMFFEGAINQAAFFIGCMVIAHLDDTLTNVVVLRTRDLEGVSLYREGQLYMAGLVWDAKAIGQGLRDLQTKVGIYSHFRENRVKMIRRSGSHFTLQHNMTVDEWRSLDWRLHFQFRRFDFEETYANVAEYGQVAYHRERLIALPD